MRGSKAWKCDSGHMWTKGIPRGEAGEQLAQRSNQNQRGQWLRTWSAAEWEEVTGLGMHAHIYYFYIYSYIHI